MHNRRCRAAEAALPRPPRSRGLLQNGLSQKQSTKTGALSGSFGLKGACFCAAFSFCAIYRADCDRFFLLQQVRERGVFLCEYDKKLTAFCAKWQYKKYFCEISLKISVFFGTRLHISTRKLLKNEEKIGIVLSELIGKGAARPPRRGAVYFRRMQLEAYLPGSAPLKTGRNVP